MTCAQATGSALLCIAVPLMWFCFSCYMVCCYYIVPHGHTGTEELPPPHKSKRHHKNKHQILWSFSDLGENVCIQMRCNKWNDGFLLSFFNQWWVGLGDGSPKKCCFLFSWGEVNHPPISRHRVSKRCFKPFIG